MKKKYKDERFIPMQKRIRRIANISIGLAFLFFAIFVYDFISHELSGTRINYKWLIGVASTSIAGAFLMIKHKHNSEHAYVGGKIKKKEDGK